MKLARVKRPNGEVFVASVQKDHILPLNLGEVENINSLADVLHSPDPNGLATYLIDSNAEPVSFENVSFAAPIDDQEVWAAGVTYKRSQVARMEESEDGADHYDKVYTADRPEIFYKANAGRVSGPGEPVRVRYDSEWSVPEPEFTLVISPEAKIVGYTVGNDMSARDIEGENPLYLPQAKLYNQCCGLGPVVLLADAPLDRSATKIVLTIKRSRKTVFTGETNLDQMARGFEDLVQWLNRENDLNTGAFLLTGTGIVPPDDFTLLDGDNVSISITGIGTLNNPVVKASNV